MATLVFSAIGASLGGSLLGSVVGSTIGAAVGRGVGAMLGRHVDQMLFGSEMQDAHSDPRERLRFTNSYVGRSIPQVYGRSRLAGQIIWAKPIAATPNDEGGYRYGSSFAVAICEGEVHRIGRIWANSQLVTIDRTKWRFYEGSEEQIADPLISSSLEEENTPAFRGICYLVFDDLDLTTFGNSIPNLEFEVFRHSNKAAFPEIKDCLTAVSIIPGTGEYALESQKVEIDKGYGEGNVVNAHRDGDLCDFDLAIEQLMSDAPKVKSTSLIVSWFGDDLRCAHCTIKPKVEQKEFDGTLPWSSGGVTRENADLVSTSNDQSVYGGTPSDHSVINAIKKLRKSGLDVMFYPFILMDISADNNKPNPWSLTGSQPANPWRGRITTNKAPIILGTTDRSSLSRIEVDNFMGNAQIGDFSNDNGNINYSGEQLWGFRRFILHYAHLCALAGGVDEFIIGSELIGLTTIRDQNDRFPFVEQLIKLANDVRTILGKDTKISYAADWSEYFGYHPQNEPGSAYFHLDELWSCENIDFIGIDNYMPMSDWRHSAKHKDAQFGSVYNLDYLQSNIAGGEGFDWFYGSENDRTNQIRTEIKDGQGEPWLWRYKDLKNWWSRPHYNRPNGIKESVQTPWQPYSKPIRFTEFGAAAIDLSSNQPNKFIDLHSSESSLPNFSDGTQDSFMQSCYIRAFVEFWNDPKNNPKSPIDGREMVIADKSYCWTWDARPWPEFPTRTDIWADGSVFAGGHWLSSRVNSVSLANIVSEICAQAGITEIDISKLYGFVQGLMFAGDETARQKIEVLMKGFQFDAFLKNGKLTFKSRDFVDYKTVDENLLVSDHGGKIVTTSIANPNFRSGRFEVHYIDGEDAYLPATVQLLVPERESDDRVALNFPIVMAQGNAKSLLEYYVWQSKQSEEKISFKIAKLGQLFEVGDLITLPKSKGEKLFRIDRIEMTHSLEIDATCLENYQLKPIEAIGKKQIQNIPQSKSVYAQFLDIPMGDTDGFHVAFGSKPWVGQVGLIENTDSGSLPLLDKSSPSSIGRLNNALISGQAGRLQPLSMFVKMTNGEIGNFENVNTCLAIGPDDYGNWELIGFKSAEPVGHSTYKVNGLYRGVRGTEHNIQEWPIGSNVVVLDGRVGFVPKANLTDQDEHLIAFGPKGDLAFWEEKTLNDPIAMSTPLPPCHIVAFKKEGQIFVSFLPRFRLDNDNWRNGQLSDPDEQSFEIIIRSNSSTIFEVNSKDTKIQFESDVTELDIQICSISSQNLKSQFTKEIIYV